MKFKVITCIKEKSPPNATAHIIVVVIHLFIQIVIVELLNQCTYIYANKVTCSVCDLCVFLMLIKCQFYLFTAVTNLPSVVILNLYVFFTIVLWQQCSYNSNVELYMSLFQYFFALGSIDWGHIVCVLSIYCKRGYFRWGKISRKCWQDVSFGGNFYDTTPISFIKAYGFYFHVGLIFMKKTKARKKRKLPPRENFHVYKICLSVCLSVCLLSTLTFTITFEP